MRKPDVTEEREMKIKYIYRPETLICRPCDSLATTALRMYADQVPALAVCADDELVGIITERELVRAIAEGVDLHAVPVDTYATPVVHTASPEEESSAVANKMLDLGIRHLPVVSNGSVINLVTVQQLIAVEFRHAGIGPAAEREFERLIGETASAPPSSPARRYAGRNRAVSHAWAGGS
jgi:CBS domain-containing protein